MDRRRPNDGAPDGTPDPAARAAALEKELAAVRAELAEERARREAAELVILRQQRDLERLERQLLGPKSERLIDPNELPLPEPPEEADAAEGDPSDEAAPVGATPEEVAAERTRDRLKKDRRRKGGRRKVADMNELRTVEKHSRAADQVCPCGCGAVGHAIGADVSWRLEYQPAEIYRIKIVLEKVVFPDHHGPSPGTVVTAEPAVSFALPRALCGNALLAQIVVDKYADFLPLFRQERRFERLGCPIARATQCDWLMALAPFLQPIWKHMSREVLSGDWLRADAGSTPVKDRTRARGKVHRGHLWAWGNYETVLFTYTSDKTAVTVASLFPGFKGTVLIDGATDFNLLERSDGVVRAGCWAHARRRFYEALKHDRTLALRGLGTIRELFMAERIVMSAPVETREALRGELCAPVLAGLRRWVDEELPQQVPSTPSHGALQYLDNQWARLEVFLTTPQIACHNNDTERDLRGPVKGRANWHYYESRSGAEMAAVFYSFIGTCLLQGLDPLAYFVEILGRLDEPPRRLTPHAIREEWQASPVS